MSFPFIVKRNNSYFIIPQISNLNSLISFKLNLKTYTAIEDKVLLKGVQCRDSIFLNHDSFDFIFTTVINSNNERVFKIYRSVENINNFIDINFSGIKESSRCAGNVIRINNENYLPIQKDKPIYGSGILLYKIKYCKDKIDFEYYHSLKLVYKLKRINGFHTISKYGKNYLIDFRFKKYFPLSLYYKIKIFLNGFNRKIEIYNIPRFLILKYLFKIKRWHLNSLIAYPRYYKIVKEINKKYKFKTVNEIGCGLGELNKYSNFKNYTGYEIDTRIINIFPFLKGGKIRHINDLNTISECTLMINFLHNLSIDQILIIYNKIKNSQYIIVDEIYKHALGYRYKHNFNLIFTSHKIKTKHPIFNDKRSLILYEKK